MAKPAKTKLPTATERTISLFTGKTDREDPIRARDGTEPVVPRRMANGKPRVSSWKPIPGTLTGWVSDAGMITLFKSGLYEARCHGVIVGTFENICDAADAIDNAPRRRKASAMDVAVPLCGIAAKEKG